MLQIVICEDNLLTLHNVGRIVERVIKKNHIVANVVLLTQRANEVEQFIKDNAANVFLLDMELGSHETGFHLASKIRENDPNAYIVFITAHFEHVLQAFKVFAFDYLVKPFGEEILEDCLLRLYKHYINNVEIKVPDHGILCIKVGSTLYKIEQKEIIYISKDGFKAAVHTLASQFSFYDTLESVMQKLDLSIFSYCHKSYVVNKSRIISFEIKNRILHLQNGYQCTVSAAYKKEFINYVR